MKERPILFSAPMVRAILAGTKTQTRRVITGHPGGDWRNDGLGRITSKHPKQGRFGLFVRRGLNSDFPECDIVPCPYGQPGDLLWLREAFRFTDVFDADSPSRVGERCIDAGYRTPWAPIQFESDGARLNWQHMGMPPNDSPPQPGKLRQSIHMPRWASRLTLRITGVRVERLRDISAADCWAEGIPHSPDVDPAHEYRDLWDSINGDRPKLPSNPESKRYARVKKWLETHHDTTSWDANPLVWVVEFERFA